MSRRRFAPFLAALFLLTSVVVTRIALAHFRVEREVVILGRELPARLGRGVRSETPFSTTPSSLVSSETLAVRSASPVFGLSAESSAQLAEQIELNGLAEQAGLN